MDILIKSKKYSEAALFCRTYLPERVPECVQLWRESIPDEFISNKIADLNNEDEEEEEENDDEGSQWHPLLHISDFIVDKLLE